jgi:hypothetical protein
LTMSASWKIIGPGSRQNITDKNDPYPALSPGYLQCGSMERDRVRGKTEG